MIWEKKEIDNHEVNALSKKYNIDKLTASIFARRNILNPYSICYYLENDIRFLHNPFLFDRMEEAVDRINAALEGGEKIYVFGDRDVDGITATVLLVRTLKELGGIVEWGLPMGDECYGLSNDLIDEVYKKEVSLLISVDCGVSNLDEIDYANKQGIDVVVIDHHNPHEYLPDACAIINPKIEESGYPFKDLSGCGVVSKLVWAIHFSRLDIYCRNMNFIYIKPANKAYVIESVRLVNLVEKKRIIEDVVPDMIKMNNTRLVSLLDSGDIYIYSGENGSQIRMLKEVFGQSFPERTQDAYSYLISAFPSLKNKSLLNIKEKSKMARYSEKPFREIDVFKHLFISAFIKNNISLSKKYVKDNMDLVALGTLGDIMPLVDENRIFVKRGLEALNKKARDGLRGLLLQNSLYSKKINSKEVSWYITPVINASGRMGEPDTAAKMLLSDKDTEISELTQYIIGLNEKRKVLGEKAWSNVFTKAKEFQKKTESNFVLVSGKAIKRGITGIIASRISKYFKVTACVVAQLEERVVGSVRSIVDINAKEFLSHFDDILTDFGGHDLAGGFTMPCDKMDEFEVRFMDVIKKITPAKETKEKIMIDAEIPQSYLSPELWNVVELFRPYGEQNPSLVFFTKEVKLRNIELMGRKDQSHLKMLIETHRYKWPAVFWNSVDRLEHDFSEGEKVDIVYHLTKNIYQNTETLRLSIVDIRRSQNI